MLYGQSLERISNPEPTGFLSCARNERFSATNLQSGLHLPPLGEGKILMDICVCVCVYTYPTDCASRLRWTTGDGVVDSLLQSVHPSLTSARRQVGLELAHHIRTHYPTKINSRKIPVKIVIGSRKQHPNNNTSKTTTSDPAIAQDNVT